MKFVMVKSKNQAKVFRDLDSADDRIDKLTSCFDSMMFILVEYWHSGLKYKIAVTCFNGDLLGYIGE